MLRRKVSEQLFFFFSSRRRHTRFKCDWSSDVCSSDLIAVFNFTPVPRHNYQIGVPLPGRWLELLNSDAPIYGGSGQGNLGGVDAAPIGKHRHLHSAPPTLPPLGATFFKPYPPTPTGT